MQLFNHNNKDKLKELLHLGNVHDAQLKSVNYNVVKKGWSSNCTIRLRPKK